MIKTADYVIDLGPEGGERGGEIVAQGTPEEVARSKRSVTAKYLKKRCSNRVRPGPALTSRAAVCYTPAMPRIPPPVHQERRASPRPDGLDGLCSSLERFTHFEFLLHLAAIPLDILIAVFSSRSTWSATRRRSGGAT